MYLSSKLRTVFKIVIPPHEAASHDEDHRHGLVDRSDEQHDDNQQVDADRELHPLPVTLSMSLYSHGTGPQERHTLYIGS
jgi:hypothetical protein